MAKNKLSRALSALSFLEWANFVGIIAGLLALVATCVTYLNNQKADTDRKVEAIDRKVEAIERKTDKLDESIKEFRISMAEVKAELRKTSDLLNADLSWRYLYQNDPTRKNLVPRYDPYTQTLEFVDTTTTRRPHVRKP